MTLKKLCICIWTTLILSPAFAQLKLPRIFSDNMVLQREQKVPVWGWAKSRDRITVTFNGQEMQTRADKEGNWRVDMEAMPAGGPFELVVKGRKEEITYQNVLIGEVWVCSGQSNMEWPMRAVNDREKEISLANYPQIRLFDVGRNLQFSPVADLEQGEKWKICTPENVPGFSAVAYFFGRKLHKDLNVPIGLINTSWGGTNVETWISKEAITAVAGFENSADGLSQEFMDLKRAEQKAHFEKLMADFGESEGGLVNSEAIWAKNDLDVSTWKNMGLPKLWEQAGLPNMDGIVWFRKTIDIPADLADQGGILLLGTIDDNDITWVNGQEVGRTNAHNENRKYDIMPGMLKAGKNVIAVRVEDTGGGGGLYGAPENMKLIVGDREFDLAGDWLYRVSPQGMRYNVGNMSPNEKPTLLFNGMISPLIPFAIQGAIWYQGESNAGRAYQYRTLFPTMINDWRKRWDREFPFLFVQLANFMEPWSAPEESAWAELREAQSMTLNLPKTGQAVIIDIGEADDIHPRNKQDVGLRLALNALKIAYDRDLVFSGPTFKSMVAKDNQVTLTFGNVGEGLTAKRDRYGYVRGFAVAGTDQKWHFAQAYITAFNQITVFSPQVERPVAVRYGWANNPDDANLYNLSGLPASPFRTDAWKGVTEK